MGCTAHLESYRRGVLVLIRALGSCSCGEKRGLGVGVAGAARVCAGQGEVVGSGIRVRGRARQMGDGRARAAAIRHSGWRNGRAVAAACAGRPNALICSGQAPVIPILNS